MIRIFKVLVASAFILLSLDAKAGIFSKNHHRNPLVEAAQLSNEQYVKELLNKGADVNSVDYQGQTALMRAAFNGNDKIAEILLENGANLNLADQKGNTALHYAALSDHPAVTKLLLKYGADKTLVNKKGQTPMELAIKNGSVYSIQVMDPGALSVVETETGFAVAATVVGGGLSKTTIVLGSAGVAAAGAGVAAAAGGGGGGSSASSSSSGGGSGDSGSGSGSSGGSTGGSSGGSPSSPSPPSCSNGFYGGEFSAYLNICPKTYHQYSLTNINADKAYARGYTGSGVVVAVVDTGVDTSHIDLDNNIALGGKSFFDNGSSGGNGSSESGGNDNTYWHGTHVAGIIAAEKNGIATHGVAYDAKILPINVYTYGDQLYDKDIANGISYSVSQGAKIINLSLGGSEAAATETISAVKSAVTQNVLVVAATGNLYEGDAASAGDQPIYPAALAGDSTVNLGSPDIGITLVGENTGALIAVGATDSSNNLASFSHKCGDAQEWCMVAPGVQIISDYPGNRVAVASGTSMAAPQVSGAAAVVMDMAAQEGTPLTSREVAEILLTTATDIGDSGVDNTYGHGLLNLDKATQPVGVTSVPIGTTVSGFSVGLNSSSVITSAAFGDAITSSSLSFMMLDGYKRAYYVPISDLAHANSGYASFDDMMRDFGNDIIQNRNKIADGVSFAADYVVESDPTVEVQEEYARVSFSSETGSGRFDVGYNLPLDEVFHPEVLDGQKQASYNMGAGSVLGLVSRGASYNNVYKLDKHNTVSFGSFDGEQSYGDVSGVVSSFSRSSKWADIGFQFGMMNEKDSFLGSKSEGAFALAGDTPTWFYNFAGALPVAKGVKIFGTANFGVSFPDAVADSLINDISKVQSFSFTSGLGKNGIFDIRDKFELVMSQPLRVASGSASLALPTARDFSGNVYQTAYNVNLSPSGREINYGAFYSLAFDESSKLNAGAIYRTQPGHNKYAQDDFFMMAKYSLGF